MTINHEVLRLVPRSQEWLESRKSMIGSSDIASLFADGEGGYHGFSTPFELYHKKKGSLPDEIEDTERMKRGRQLERVIAEMACEDNGWAMAADPVGIYRRTDIRGMGATPDFFALDADGGMGALECKNVDFLIFRDEWQDGEPPLKYLLQLQHQLACTGLSWGAVAALVGGNDLRVYRYERHQAAIDAIETAVVKFWRDYDAEKEPAPVADDLEIIGSVYKRKPLSVVDLSGDNEMPMLCADVARLSAERLAAEKREKEAKALVIQKMAGHDKAIVQGFSKVEYPERTRVNQPREASVTTYRQLTIKEF